MRSLGMDIGSRAIKVTLFHEDRLVGQRVEDTGTEPVSVCRSLLEDLQWDELTVTGYGRHLVKERWPQASVISEIKAVALGAVRTEPRCRSIIDIGGQDSKVIALDEKGRAQKFVMNDRCAAGTGQFLEMMATTLGFTHDEFVAAARGASEAQSLSSLCSVFAQTEIVSLIARGARKEEIALGVHQSIANRTAALAGGTRLLEPVLFTGGCARNACLVSLLSWAIGKSLIVPESPQTVASMGCAVHRLSGVSEDR